MARDKICTPFLALASPENKFTVNTIEDMQSRKYLKIGDVVELNGYYTAGDGAGHKRKIEPADDGSGVQLANGLWANIVHSGEVNVSWFGELSIDNFKIKCTLVIDKDITISNYKNVNISFNFRFLKDKKMIIDNSNFIFKHKEEDFYIENGNFIFKNMEYDGKDVSKKQIFSVECGNLYIKDTQATLETVIEDGTKRGGMFIRASCDGEVLISNVCTKNMANGISILESKRCKAIGLNFNNYQTGIYVRSSGVVNINDIYAENTLIQSQNWLGMEEGAITNGMDSVMIEESKDIYVSRVVSKFAIERVCYLRAKGNIECSDVYFENSHGIQCSRAISQSGIELCDRAYVDNIKGFALEKAGGLSSFYGVRDIVVNNVFFDNQVDSAQSKTYGVSIEGVIAPTDNISLSNAFLKNVRTPLQYSAIAGQEIIMESINLTNVQTIDSTIDGDSAIIWVSNTQTQKIAKKISVVNFSNLYSNDNKVRCRRIISEYFCDSLEVVDSSFYLKSLPILVKDNLTSLNFKNTRIYLTGNIRLSVVEENIKNVFDVCSDIILSSDVDDNFKHYFFSRKNLTLSTAFKENKWSV